MRIFVDPGTLASGERTITGDEHHYIARVRRAAVGDEIVLFDGAGQRAPATIIAITDDATTVTVLEPYTMSPPLPRIRVVLPLIKGDRMDFALEKLVEVGVDEIVVWPAARSVVKLDADRRDARIEKYALAVQAAARQSGRPQVPSVTWADSLASVVDQLGVKLVLDPGTETPIVMALDALEGMSDDGTAHELTLVSGPEGGLAPNELATLLGAGFTPVGLGPRVLRAETAPVAAIAIVRALTHS
jgi:16S rRNA (uracil1498-N3)-methyltransferase